MDERSPRGHVVDRGRLHPLRHLRVQGRHVDHTAPRSPSTSTTSTSPMRAPWRPAPRSSTPPGPSPGGPAPATRTTTATPSSSPTAPGHSAPSHAATPHRRFASRTRPGGSEWQSPGVMGRGGSSRRARVSVGAGRPWGRSGVGGAAVEADPGVDAHLDVVAATSLVGGDGDGGLVDEVGLACS